MKKLLKDKRNIWYVIAMFVGVVAICVGISFLDRKFYSVLPLEEVTFGADFYTEIYNASRRIHGVASNINALIEYVKQAIGYTFIFGGLIDICVFGSKLNFVKSEPVVEEAEAFVEAESLPNTEPVVEEETTIENN